MDHVSVSSSNIKSIGYDASAQLLEIAFISGGLYEYANVPANVYEGLMSASSHGSYFHQHIKDKYTYRKKR